MDPAKTLIPEPGGQKSVSSAAPTIEMHDIAIDSLSEGRVVVEQVEWTVAQNDFWVIGGLQGSGKSDFISMTAGLVPPRSGTYRLFGDMMPIFDAARLPTRLRMGLVFQTGQLFSHLTVRENIGLPLRYHKNLSAAEVASRVDEFLKEFELDAFTNSTPGAMAGSWQKRVGLARALLLEPELLLLDNPLTGLDPRHTSWWLSFLVQLNKGHELLHGRPVTLVVTAEQLRPWAGRARQFAVLRLKQFVALGTWAQVEAAPRELVYELLAIEKQDG